MALTEIGNNQSGTSARSSARKRPTDRFIVIAVILLIGIILFVIYQGFRQLMPGIETTHATSQTIDTVTALDFYVIRDEKNVVAPGNADARDDVVVWFATKNGEKVAKNGKLFELYEVGYTDSTADRKSFTAEKQASIISAFDRCYRQYELNQLNKEALNIKKYDELREELYCDVLNANRNSRLRKSQTDMQRFAYLSASSPVSKKYQSPDIGEVLSLEKTALLQDCSYIGEYHTGEPGWYYYSTDGFEELFSYDSVLTMTPEQFLAGISRMTDYRAQTGNSVHIGGKMVYSSVWYACSSVDTSLADSFDVGYKYAFSVTDSSGTRLDMKCVRKQAGTDSENKTLVVFECQQMPSDFLFPRFFSAQVTVDTQRGFIIPKSVIQYVTAKDSNGTERQYPGVYILDSNTVRFKVITVLDEYDDFYLIADSYDPGAIETAETEASEPESSTEDGTDTGTGQADGTDADTVRQLVEKYGYLETNQRIITSGTSLYDGKYVN